MDGVSPRALDPLGDLARRRQSEPNVWVVGTENDGKPSGERNSTVAPNPFRVRASDVSVRTTPLTCGCQASVAMRMRAMPPVFIPRA